MKLKLLNRKDTTLENKDLGIRLKLGFVMPEHVSEVQGFYTTSSNPAFRIALYALREFVSELYVEDELMDAKRVSYSIDTSAPENRPFLMVVAALVIEHLLVSDEVKKKSGSQPSATTPESSAETARTD